MGRSMGIYDTGNCLTFPVMSIERCGNDFFVRNTGNALGCPFYCYRRIGKNTECYLSGCFAGTPNSRFEFSRSRKDIYWYDNKHYNSWPCMSMRVLNENFVEIYDIGGFNAAPKWSFKKHGDRVYFYDTGNAASWSIYSIDNVASIDDVLEGCFLAFVTGFI